MVTGGGVFQGLAREGRDMLGLYDATLSSKS